MAHKPTPKRDKNPEYGPFKGERGLDLRMVQQASRSAHTLIHRDTHRERSGKYPLKTLGFGQRFQMNRLDYAGAKRPSVIILSLQPHLLDIHYLHGAANYNVLLAIILITNRNGF